jgi:uncharacterized protein (TIGR00369 family)
MAVTFEQMRDGFAGGLPLAKSMGITLDEMGEGMVKMHLPYDEALIGDPRTGVIHGGAVSVLLDTASGGSVFAHPQNAGATATIDLRIDYMRSAAPGKTIHARARVFHTARTVAFVRCAAWVDDEDTPIATGAGAFTFIRAKS